MEAKVTTPVTKGVIISLILIVFGLILYFSGQWQNRSLGSIQYLILLAGIIWACINYAKQMNANVTFGNVFGHGFKTTAVVAVIIIIYTALFFKVIFPDSIEQIISQARKEMEAKNNMSDDQMETALTMTRKFFLVFAIGGVIIVFAIVGAIGSLIGAAAAKKNPAASTPFQSNV